MKNKIKKLKRLVDVLSKITKRKWFILKVNLDNPDTFYWVRNDKDIVEIVNEGIKFKIVYEGILQ